MNGRTKRILSIVLTLCMLVSLFPATALGLDAAAQTQSQGTEVVKGSSIPGTGYHVTSVKNYSIAPDISERVIITNNDAGNSQTVANVMEVNTSGGRAKIVAGYGNRNPKEQGWTLKTTTDQAHVYEKESGLNVVGGVNASWFNINTGEPSGYLVMNGVVHHDNSSRAFIAAFDDGSVNVFREGTTLAQAEADQSAKQGKTVKILEAVDALVAMVWDGKVVITESGNSGYYPRTCVGIKADGTVVLFQADGTMAPRSVGYTAAEEARMMVALGCVAAIQLDEGGSSTYISQREGEQDVTMRNTPAGGSERVVSGTILVVSTVAASGEFDHAAVTPDDEYYTPGSSVTLTAEAMDFSGAAAKALPEDAVFTVSDASMGTVTATDLSGSSASAVFTSSGKTGDVTVNLVSGGQTVGSAVLHIQNPDKLAFASDEVNLNYKDVSDLLQRLEDEMAERLILVCKKYAYSTSEVDAFPYLTELYRFARDNADLCLVLLGPNGDRAYTERICGILRSYFLRDFLARFYSGSSDRLDYFCSFIVSGNLTLTLEWLSGGAKETPEEMAALAGAIIMDGVRTL